MILTLEKAIGAYEQAMLRAGKPYRVEHMGDAEKELDLKQPLAAFDVLALVDYLTALKKRGCSNGKIQLRLQALKHFFNWAIEVYRLTSSNPTYRIKGAVLRKLQNAS